MKPIVVTESLIESASPEQLADMVRGLCSSYRQLLESITAERKLYDRHIATLEDSVKHFQPRAEQQKIKDQSRIRQLEEQLEAMQKKLRTLKTSHKKEMAKLTSAQQQQCITVGCDSHLL